MGRTLVTAGKLDKEDLSYSELASSSETSTVKHVQWMINQSGRSGHGKLFRCLCLCEGVRWSMHSRISVTRKYKA